MCSVDVTSLFTNVPVDEVIQLCLDKLFSGREKVHGLTRKQLQKLLVISVKENHFLFDNEYYDQIDGVGMGSPLGPALASVFMCNLEQEAFAKCPKEFAPEFYRRYVDDTFLVFNCENHAKR